LRLHGNVPCGNIHGMSDVLRLDPAPAPAPASATEAAADGSIYFIGNATVLLRYRGFTILTDPTFVHKHEEVPLGYGLHTKRLTDPAIDIADLPPLDFVLLSHFHGDHFDRVAEQELDKSLPIITTPQARKELTDRGFSNATGLDTWEKLTVTKGDSEVRITSCPGRHGPGVTDFVLPDVMGSVLEFPATAGESARRIYVSGDTLVYDDLREIPQRYPDLDVGLLHLGGTRVMGIMVTMDAEQGVEAMRIIAPNTVIPVHYNDYDVFTSSLEDFLDAVDEAGLRDRVHPLRHGDTYTFR
jgi:L-ascorbate metabolism protein UlaG (beta-lactamase superfamily)